MRAVSGYDEFKSMGICVVDSKERRQIGEARSRLGVGGAVSEGNGNCSEGKKPNPVEVLICDSTKEKNFLKE